MPVSFAVVPCPAAPPPDVADREMIRAYTGSSIGTLPHSVEVWQEGQLAGGVYGVAISSRRSGKSFVQGVQWPRLLIRKRQVLPSVVPGSMSSLPFPLVAGQQEKLAEMTGRMGGIDDPFMYLSFLSLTVIPVLRITDRGVFDTELFRDVPLFVKEE